MRLRKNLVTVTRSDNPYDWQAKVARNFSPNSIKLESLLEYEPITENQKLACDFWDDGYNLILSGSAGTGKTFIAFNLALEDVLDRDTVYDKMVVIRSIVPTRDIGFLPGDETEKKRAYTLPYIGICEEILGTSDAWDKLIDTKKVQFESTSFIRGTTFNDAIILVDEMQNLNFHELDSVITRIGRHCRLILCGDYYQSDFEKERDKSGVRTFMEIAESMPKFEIVKFTWKDIVRSDLVRDYIMSKEMLGINNG